MIDPSTRFAPILSILVLALLIGAATGISGCTSSSGTPAGRQAASPGTAAAWKIDHVVIVVDNLSAARQHFAEAGFSVVAGGEHGGGSTRNALVPFADGSYLELFAPADPAMAATMKALVAAGTFDAAMQGENAMDIRFMRHLATGAGPRDFAISRPGLNLSAIRNTAGNQGIALDGPIPMSRTRPDGVEVKWQVVVPVSVYSTAVPFLIADDTPRNLRVPEGNATVQPNGAAGIRRIVIATRDTGNITRWYDTVLTQVPKSLNATTITYALNGSVIIVQDASGTQHEGPVEIVLGRQDGGEFVLGNSTWD